MGKMGKFSKNIISFVEHVQLKNLPTVIFGALLDPAFVCTEQLPNQARGKKLDQIEDLKGGSKEEGNLLKDKRSHVEILLLSCSTIMESLP